MSAQNRPRRKRKGDRLLSPDATRNEVACDYAIAPFDRLATEMDRKWGIDQLPALVGPELAQRYGNAIAHLNETLSGDDPDKCRAAAENCIKGLRALDAAAEASGAKKATGDFWEYELDDFRFAVMPDNSEWMTAKSKRPDLQFYSMREVALALKHYAELVPMGEVKNKFPGAQIAKINNQSELSKELDDEIRF